MPEMIDVYNSAGEWTGRVVEKRTPLFGDDHFLHVVALLRGRDGLYLLQQRSLKSKHGPGRWDITGGGVTHGENSREAIAREVLEELGLACAPEAFVYAGRLRQELEDGRGYLLDMYGLNADFFVRKIFLKKIFSERFAGPFRPKNARGIRRGIWARY